MEQDKRAVLDCLLSKKINSSARQVACISLMQLPYAPNSSECNTIHTPAFRPSPLLHMHSHV